jgi:hypothetical protein
MKSVSRQTVRLFLGSLAVVSGAALAVACIVNAEPASAAQEVPGHAASAWQPTFTTKPTKTSTTTKPTKTSTTTKPTKPTTTTTTSDQNDPNEDPIADPIEDPTDDPMEDPMEDSAAELPWGLPIGRR